MTLGVTGVVWLPRTATGNSTRLLGPGPVPLHVAGGAWGSVAAAFTEASVSIAAVTAALTAGWEGESALLAQAAPRPFRNLDRCHGTEGGGTVGRGPGRRNLLRSRAGNHAVARRNRCRAGCEGHRGLDGRRAERQLRGSRGRRSVARHPRSHGDGGFRAGLLAPDRQDHVRSSARHRVRFRQWPRQVRQRRTDDLARSGCDRRSDGRNAEPGRRRGGRPDR